MAGSPPKIESWLEDDRKVLVISFKECPSVPFDSVSSSFDVLSLEECGIFPPKTSELERSEDGTIRISIRRPSRIPAHWLNKRFIAWREELEQRVLIMIIGIQSGIEHDGIAEHISAELSVAA